MSTGRNITNSAILKPEDEDTLNHDQRYLTYLNNTFGTSSIPLFGSILCVFGMVLVCLLSVFTANIVTNNDVETKKPLAVKTTYTLPGDVIVENKEF